jgi:hypothetical protein
MGSGLANPEVLVGFFSENDDGTNYSQQHFERIRVRETYVHPDYDFSNASHDIALLQLERASLHPPVRISFDPDLLTVPGRTLTVAGWGRTENGRPAVALNAVDVSLVSNATCNAPTAWNGAVLDSHICAGGGIFDACDGDSGGPLIIDGKVADEDQQVGIVSWGKAVRCGQPGKPGVYVNLSAPSVRDFIQNKIPGLARATDDGGGRGAGEGEASSSMPAEEGKSPPSVDPASPPPAPSIPGADVAGEAAALIRDAILTPNSSAAAATSSESTSVERSIMDLYALMESAPGLEGHPVDGFTRYLGLDVGEVGDVSCAGTLWPGGCQVDGDATAVAAACRADPRCTAFVHLPAGYGKRPQPTGFLKGNPVAVANLTPNAFTTTYFLITNDPETGDKESSWTEKSQSPSLSSELGSEWVPLGAFDWTDSYDFACPESEWAGGCKRTVSEEQAAVEAAAFCRVTERCGGFVLADDGAAYLKDRTLDPLLLRPNAATQAYFWRKRRSVPNAKGGSAAPLPIGPTDSSSTRSSHTVVTPSPRPNLTLPDGYALIRFKSVGTSAVDVACNDVSVEPHRCVLAGTLMAAMERCTQISSCQAIEFWPHNGTGISVLKGGPVLPSELRVAKASHVYLRQD